MIERQWERFVCNKNYVNTAVIASVDDEEDDDVGNEWMMSVRVIMSWLLSFNVIIQKKKGLVIIFFFKRAFA